MMSSIASTLNPELAEALSTLFSKLDCKSQGSISLDDLKHNWEQDSHETKTVANNVHSGASTLKHERVLQSIEKFAVEGRLSYERLCCGIKLSLIEEMIEKDQKGSTSTTNAISNESKGTKVKGSRSETKKHSNGDTEVGVYVKEAKDLKSDDDDDHNTSTSSIPDWKKQYFSSSHLDNAAKEAQNVSSSSMTWTGKDDKFSEERKMLRNRGRGDRNEMEEEGRVFTSSKTAVSQKGATVGTEDEELMPSGYKELLYSQKWSSHSLSDPTQNKQDKKPVSTEVSASRSSSGVEKSSSGYWSSSKSEKSARTLVSITADDISSEDSSARLLSSNVGSSPSEKTTPFSASSAESRSSAAGKSLKWKETEWKSDCGNKSKVLDGENVTKDSKSEKLESNPFQGEKSFDVSTYSVNDKSLLTQSFMENFGYHPPRELTPVSLQLPQYNLPSTILASSSLEEQTDASVCKTPSKNANDEVSHDSRNNDLNSKRSLMSDLKYQNGSRMGSLAHLDNGKEVSSSNGHSEKSSNDLEKFLNEKNDSLARAQKEIKKFETKLQMEQLPVATRPFSSNSNSTYTVKNARSPIPPVSRTAYYELNDGSDDEKDDKKQSKETNEDKCYMESKSESFPKRSAVLEQSLPKLTHSTPYKDVDPPRTLHSASSERYEFPSQQKEINGIGPSREVDGYELKSYTNGYQTSKPKDGGLNRMSTEGSYFPSQYLNVQCEESSPATNTQTEKMDKMLDQALRAVNESYRLIRIGKKNLRRSDSMNGSRSSSSSSNLNVSNNSTLIMDSSLSPNKASGVTSSNSGGATAAVNSEKYLRLMNCVLELHKALLDMIDPTNGEIPADLGDGQESCSQCGVCATCQRNLQTFQLAVDQLELRNSTYTTRHHHHTSQSSLHNRSTFAAPSNTPERITRNYPTSGTTDPGTSQQYKPLIATTSHAPGSRADLTGSSSSKLALLTPAKE